MHSKYFLALLLGAPCMMAMQQPNNPLTDARLAEIQQKGHDLQRQRMECVARLAYLQALKNNIYENLKFLDEKQQRLRESEGSLAAQFNMYRRDYAVQLNEYDIFIGEKQQEIVALAYEEFNYLIQLPEQKLSNQ